MGPSQDRSRDALKKGTDSVEVTVLLSAFFATFTHLPEKGGIIMQPFSMARTTPSPSRWFTLRSRARVHRFAPHRKERE